MSSRLNLLSDDDVSHSFDSRCSSVEDLENDATELRTAEADLDSSFELEHCHMNSCPSSSIQTSLPCWLHYIDIHGRGKQSYRNIGILFPEVLEKSEDVSVNPKFKNYELTLRKDLDKGKARWGDNICCDWFIYFVNYNPLTQILLHNPLSSLRWDFRVIMCLVYFIYIYITVDFDPHSYEKKHYKFDKEGFERAHPELIEEKIRIEDKLKELSKEKIDIEEERKKEAIQFKETLDKLTMPGDESWKSDDQSWKSRRRLDQNLREREPSRKKGGEQAKEESPPLEGKSGEKDSQSWKKSHKLQENLTHYAVQAEEESSAVQAEEEPSVVQAEEEPSAVERNNGKEEQENGSPSSIQAKEEPDERSGDQRHEKPTSPARQISSEEGGRDQKEKSIRSKSLPALTWQSEKFLFEKLKIKNAIQKLQEDAKKRGEKWQSTKQKIIEKAKKLGEKWQPTKQKIIEAGKKTVSKISKSLNDKRSHSNEESQKTEFFSNEKTLKAQLLEEFGKEQAQYGENEVEMLKTLREKNEDWKKLVADEENLQKENYGKEKEIEFKKKNYESWWSETIFPPKSNLAQILSPLFLINAMLQRTIIAHLAMCKCVQEYENCSRRSAKTISRLFLYLYLIGSICLLWFISSKGWLIAGRKSTEFFTTIVWGFLFDIAKSTGLFTYKLCRGSGTISWKHFKAWKNIGFPDMISIQENRELLKVIRKKAQNELGYLNGEAEKEEVLSQRGISHEELENLLGNFCCDGKEIQKMVAKLQLNPPYTFEEVRQLFKNLTKNKMAAPKNLNKASLQRALESIEFSEFCPFAYAKEEMEREEKKE